MMRLSPPRRWSISYLSTPSTCRSTPGSRVCPFCNRIDVRPAMLGTTLSPRQFLDRVAAELGRINPAEVQKLADLVHERYKAGRFVFVIGNGGSGSNASHFCEDMGKGTLARKFFDDDTKKRLRIVSLTDNTPYILAWGNDEGFDRVFVEQLKNLASPGDMLVAISGSGNSPNVLKAVEWANAH